MLQQFNFENFHSFRDEMSLDLSAAKISEFENTVVKVGNEKLLPVIAIYGANASGKSNVLSALRNMCFFVTNSHFCVDGNIRNRFSEGYSREKMDFEDYYNPFLFDKESANGRSEFEVYYTDKDEKTVNYGFSMDREGVAEEWLLMTAKSHGSKPRLIFRRDRDEGLLDLSGIPKKSAENLRIALSSKALIVSLGMVLKIDVLRNVFEWFNSMEFIDYGNLLNLLQVNYRVPDGLTDDENLRKRVASYLASFDKSIVGLTAKKVKGENDKEYVRIRILHNTVDGERTYPLSLGDESDGTKKMLSMFSFLDRVLTSGNVLVVDELNAKLHPLLMRHLLTLFLDPEKNPNHAQLVFTCHDAWLLKSGLLRRDEIWFTEKSETGLSNLYSLADFVDDEGYKIRKDADYEKNYLLGKYGAIPTLEALDMFEERADEVVDGDE